MCGFVIHLTCKVAVLALGYICKLASKDPGCTMSAICRCDAETMAVRGFRIASESVVK